MHQQDSRPSLDDWALGIARVCSARSTCPRRKAGAVALDANNLIVGIGYNGVPRGFQHCTEQPCPGAHDPPGDTSRCLAVHAEANAIMNSRDPMSITRMYVTATPCLRCALLIANLPRMEVLVAEEPYPDEAGIQILRAAGVRVLIITPGMSTRS